jgi:hypothetical protein
LESWAAAVSTQLYHNAEFPRLRKLLALPSGGIIRRKFKDIATDLGINRGIEAQSVQARSPNFLRWHMLRPPDPEMRSPVTRQSDRASSQLSALGSTNNTHGPREFQVRKLRRLFSFAHETAQVIASLCFHGGR